MHILFITDNFPPETNAPASRTFEHCIRWVGAGHKVTVITCFPNFPAGKVFAGYKNLPFKVEVIQGIRVIRVWSYITANEGFVKRTLDYVSFALTSLFAGLFVKGANLIIATSPQFFCAIGGYLLSRIKRRPFVFELRDLWPDSIVAVGAMKESFAIRVLRRLEYFLYRSAALIVSVTNSFKAVLVSNGIDPDKIVIVPNGIDSTIYCPGQKPLSLLQRFQLEGKFVVAYVGTVGLAHGLGTVLESAAALRNCGDIVFIIVGTGAQRVELESQCRERALSNVLFVGSVTKQEVVDYWRLCDVALVVLRDTPLFSHVLPSKMFEAMGMERPIILGVRGESKQVLEAAGAGIPVPPEDEKALTAAIDFLRKAPESATSMGRSGRLYVVKEFNRDTLAQRMLEALKVVGEKT
jgi:colanic acid biosynthesis glycosyl transferase WcaI